ncbi:MAG TPA: hypothetical protein V6C78_02095 [Crinalium sp.]|jgi:hypothetical protein
MSILPNLLRSLLITSIFAFLAPAILVGAIWILLFCVGYLPHLEAIGQMGIEQILQFLQVFGSGSAMRGLLIICTVCSLVGVLFDTYTFYRYQKLNS